MINTKVILVALALVAFVHAQGDYHHDTHYTGKSYALFHGPVEGKVQEVHGEVSDKHGKKHIKFVDYYAYPHYKFEYGVEDKHTGDQKQQKEYRDGYKVEGEYALKEPSGNIRNIKYYADKKDGFFAHYKTESVHPAGKHH